MKRRFTVVLSLLLVVMMVFTTTSAFAKTKAELDTEIKKEQTKLKEGQAKEKELDGELEDLEAQITEKESLIQSLNDELDEIQVQIDEVDVELKAAEEKVAIQNDNLNGRLRSMYKNGSVGFVDVILSSGSISELISNIEMVKLIYSSDQQVLEELQENYDLIETKKTELEELQQTQTAKKQQEEDAQKDLEDDIRAASEKKREISSDNQIIEDNIASLEAEAYKLDDAISSDMNSNSGGSGGASYTGGIFTWPVPGNSGISSDWGWRDCPFHGREWHSGIDVPATRGTPVVAAESGVVVFAGYGNSLGNYIIISHGGGLYTVYAHNSSLVVRNGNHVSKGQQIAKIGSTGDSTGPHLHFEVRKGYNDRSANVDPANYLPAAYFWFR